MSRTLAALVGGAAGAVALLGIVAIVIWLCLLYRRSVSRTSESNSSDRSSQVGRNTEISLREGISYQSDSQGARCFVLDELNMATKNFSSINLIGYGTFGEVYKGLLQEGTLVAIKRRSAAPSREYVEEVLYLSSIRHQNLVSLLGYCQENDLQMLVYEYTPNGSVSSHLYGKGQKLAEKLEFRQRLSIALGAAKGLHYLHVLTPPLVHMDFKTANVLVDGNLNPKVADAGLKSLIDKNSGAGSSKVMADDLFSDPQAKETGNFSPMSDVYSFGVFLLELVSGREARTLLLSGSNKSIIEGVHSYQEASDISDIVDHRMGTSFSTEGVRELLRLIGRCLDPSRGRRPTMSHIVMELERMHEREMSLTTIMGEGTSTVTLGSQLFTAG